MAEALVEERHLLKSLRWWDGFVIALCNPGFLIASLGFSMGALGIVIPIVVLSVVAGIRILILLPVVMSFWFLFYMPRWRRRVRQQARSLQRWQLHPE